MAYTPLEPATIVPGITGNAVPWGVVVANADEAYGYAPHYINCGVDVRVTATSFTQVFEWVLPEDPDEGPIELAVRWRVNGGTGTCDFIITDGTFSNSASTTTTSTSLTWSTITLTPSSSAGHPRIARLRFRVTSTFRVEVEHIVCAPAPAAPSAGVRPSGFAKMAGWDLDGVEGAVPTEPTARLANNARAVARARPAGLVALLDDVTHGAGGSAPRYQTTSSDFQLQERWLQPSGDPGPRLYRVACKLERTSTAAPEARIIVGPWQGLATSIGWNHFVVELALGPGHRGSVYTRVASGAGTVFLEALQVMREKS